MITVNVVKTNRYQDSVTLMQVAKRLRSHSGVEDAALMMGTAPNKEMLDQAGLLAAEGTDAGPNDLIIAVRGNTDALQVVQTQIEDLLQAEAQPPSKGHQAEPRTLAEGFAIMPDANLVLISTPGIYAAAEARKALAHNRHVMMFSDNVSLQDEYELKREASRRGLLMMGPDCGTAIIGGVPLGFANAVRPGAIGVVGASGTGMQEITCLVDRYGGGISHAIGTGSRDLSEEISGEMTVAGLKALLTDAATGVIVVVSKPPQPRAMQRVMEAAEGSTKPIIFAFLGVDASAIKMPSTDARLEVAATLELAAIIALQATGIKVPHEANAVSGSPQAAAALRPEQRYVRGLFSGGTFCYETMLVLRESLGGIYSNTPLSPEWKLLHGHASREHTCLDMGADEFTVGRPHPMIDFSERAQRLIAEAVDDEVAVLLLDVVVGYGAHPDPASGLAEAIDTARSRSAEWGVAMPVIIASICGTERDPQGLQVQRQKLLDAGVIIAPSNAAAARFAASITKKLPISTLR